MKIYKILLGFLGLTFNICAMVDYTKNIENPSAQADSHYSLILASYQGDISNAQKFLTQSQQAGYDIDTVDHLWRNGPSWNPLIAATIMGNYDVVTLLMQHGASPTTGTTTQNFSALSDIGGNWRKIPSFFRTLPFDFTQWNARDIATWAAKNAPAQERNNYQKIINIFNQRPVIPTKPIPTPKPPETPSQPSTPQTPPSKKSYTHLSQEQKNNELINAILESDREKVKDLLRDGAHVNAKYRDGLTPLIIASMSNKPTIIKILIENRAHLNDQGDDGFTALMHAAQKDRIDIVKLLIEHGADVTIKNNEGKTAFHLASSQEIKSILLTASPNQQQNLFNQNITRLVNTLDMLRSQLGSK